MSSAPRGVSRLDSAPDLLAATLGDYLRTPRQAPPAPVRPDQGTPPPAAVPPDWRTEAACRGMDQGLWFPPMDGDQPIRAAALAVAAAKAICAGCPVRCACLDFAVTTRQLHGVWGGLTEKERRAVKRKRRKTGDAATAPHGTAGRYSNNGCRCALCLAAWREAKRERRARKAAQS